MSHPFVGIYFVNKGTNITSFEMAHAKNLLCNFFFFTHFHIEITSIVTVTLPRLYNFFHTMQLMNGIVC